MRWEDLGWLRESTKLPMLLKGIQHPDDVRKARDYGIDGIYCSNHGGRQANGGLPSLELCPPLSRQPTACRCFSIRACAVGPTSQKRWRWELPQSDWPHVPLCPGYRRCRRSRVPIACRTCRTRPTHGCRRLPQHRRPPGGRCTTHLTRYRFGSSPRRRRRPAAYAVVADHDEAAKPLSRSGCS